MKAWRSIDSWDIASGLSLAAITWTLYLYKLGTYPLREWDEAIYATGAKSVLNGNSLVPHTYIQLGGAAVGLDPFLEKPPLAMWFEAAWMAVLGPTELAARLPAALAAIGAAALIYAVCSSWGNRTLAYLSSVVFLTTPGLSFLNNGARFGGTDMLLTFFGSLAVFAVISFVRTNNANRLYIASVALALAILSKGVAAGIFGFVLLPYLVIHRHRFYRRETATAAAVCALLVLPWFFFAWLSYGELFIHEFFIEQVISRAADSSNYPYFRDLVLNERFYYPWVFFLPIAGLNVLRRRLVGIESFLYAFLLWWTLLIPLFYRLTGNHSWYILPMFVPASILIGLFGRDMVYFALDRIDTIPFQSALSVFGAVGVAITLLVPLMALGLPFTPHFDSIEAQQYLAGETNEHLNAGDTVYVASDLPAFMHTYGFYLDDVSAVGVKHIPHSENTIKYILINNKKLDNFNNGYEIIASSDVKGETVVLVKLE